MPNVDNINTGNSGEYFVAAELERRGFIVAVPMSHVENFDILAIHRKTYRQYAIQVKTTRYKQRKWTLTAKNETLVGNNIIYVFVSLNNLENPTYHIVPSIIVAQTIQENHRKWLNIPSKTGAKHNDNNLRNFEDKEGIYLNNWNVFS